MSERTKRVLNISLTVLFIVALCVFMITFAIGLPIYCRFFYYIQIKTLDMEVKTGWSYDVIKEAYDDILNFCTMTGFECKTGQLRLSESGAAHFADCKVLFDLNLGGIVAGGAISLTLLLLNRFKVIALCRPFGHRPQLIAAIAALALPVIIIILVLISGFDRAFEVFHAVFFPGKDNWRFSAYEDQIINVMPEQFFFNCAVIVAVGLIAFAAAVIIADLVLFHKEKKRDGAQNLSDGG